MRYILFVCAFDIGILSINSIWGLPIIGLLSVIATYKFSFNSKVYLSSHLIMILILGFGIFLLDGLTDDFLFSKRSEWNFLNLESPGWKVWISLTITSLAVVFQQLYFLIRSLWTKNRNISFLIVTLLTTINFGLVVAVKLLFPIAVLYRSQYVELINIAAITALLFFSILTLFASTPRQLLVRLMAIQSTIVFLGFVQFNGMGESGAVVQWIVTLLAGTGFGLCILMFENRVGKNEFKVSSVAFEKMPRIAFLYFFFGLAMVDFPGTLGFVGEDLLVHAVLNESAALGFVILLTMACTSIAIYKSFTVLFLGKKLRPNELRVDLVKREAMGMVLLVGSLVSFSFSPGIFFSDNISQNSTDIGQNQISKPNHQTEDTEYFKNSRNLDNLTTFERVEK